MACSANAVDRFTLLITQYDGCFGSSVIAVTALRPVSQPSAPATNESTFRGNSAAACCQVAPNSLCALSFPLATMLGQLLNKQAPCRGNYMKNRSSPPGFTLVEMAIVLVIIGLVLSMGVSALITQRLNTQIQTTKANEDAIKTALITFISRNNRLPCPALPGTGIEASNPGTCTGAATTGSSVRGIVPWISLGLPDAAGADAWNNRYTYQVTSAATVSMPSTLSQMRGTMTVHSGTPVVKALPPTGNQINSCSTVLGDNSCNMDAVVVVMSHGENGFGAYTLTGTQLAAPTSPNETQNASVSEAFVKADYSNNAATAYDDVVLALSPDDLLGPLAQQGAVQSARAITNSQMQQFAATLSNYIIAHNGMLPPPPVPAPVDGWGSPLLYNPAVAKVCGAPPGATAFTLSSAGVDKMFGTNPNTNNNDDLAFTQPTDDILLAINKQGAACP